MKEPAAILQEIAVIERLIREDVMKHIFWHELPGGEIEGEFRGITLKFLSVATRNLDFGNLALTLSLGRGQDVTIWQPALHITKTPAWETIDSMRKVAAEFLGQRVGKATLTAEAEARERLRIGIETLFESARRQCHQQGTEEYQAKLRDTIFQKVLEK